MQVAINNLLIQVLIKIRNIIIIQKEKIVDATGSRQKQKKIVSNTLFILFYFILFLNNFQIFYIIFYFIIKQ